MPYVSQQKEILPLFVDSFWVGATQTIFVDKFGISKRTTIVYLNLWMGKNKLKLPKRPSQCDFGSERFL